IAGEMLLRRQAADVPYGTPVVLGNFTVYFMAPMTHARPGAPGSPPHLQARPAAAAQGAGGAAAEGAPAPVIAEAKPAAGAAGPVQPRVLSQAPITSPEAIQKRERDVALRREVHKLLLEHLDLATMDPSKVDDPSMRPKVLGALRRIVGNLESRVPADTDRD